MALKMPRVFSEPMPPYMSAMGMQWARFVDDPSGGAGGNGAPAGGDGKPAGEAAGDGSDDSDLDKIDGLGDGGKNAIKGERAKAREALAAKAAVEAENARLKALVDAADEAKLSDLEKAQKATDDTKAENARLATENMRLTALAKFPVSEENQSLVTGSDAASFLAAAERIHKLEAAAAGKAPKQDIVPGSGSGGHNGDKSGGTVRSGADLYNQRHKKTI